MSFVCLNMVEIICKDCGLLKKHQGHGLCKVCLQREYRGSLPNELRHNIGKAKRRIKLISYRDNFDNNTDEEEFVSSILHPQF